jgi:hypothetical protein
MDPTGKYHNGALPTKMALVYTASLGFSFLTPVPLPLKPVVAAGTPLYTFINNVVDYQYSPELAAAQAWRRNARAECQANPLSH